MSGLEIASAIETIVQRNYAVWQIGITNYPVTRQSEWQKAGRDTAAWRSWQAVSLKDAQAIESQFLKKGMKAGNGIGTAEDSGIFVYIF